MKLKFSGSGTSLPNFFWHFPYYSDSSCRTRQRKCNCHCQAAFWKSEKNSIQPDRTQSKQGRRSRSSRYQICLAHGMGSIYQQGDFSTFYHTLYTLLQRLGRCIGIRLRFNCICMETSETTDIFSLCLFISFFSISVPRSTHVNMRSSISIQHEIKARHEITCCGIAKLCFASLSSWRNLHSCKRCDHRLSLFSFSPFNKRAHLVKRVLEDFIEVSWCL
ncbi:hypothetical protein F4859DRAFT_60611 [Xylaria cf. heliscus]|nr:hypothetical protein F4859DRAFT_60611 [Xylaria cf. heliscus]